MKLALKQIWNGSVKKINQHKFNYVINTMLLQIFIGTFGILLLSYLFKLTLFMANVSNISYVGITNFLTNPLAIIGLVLYFMCFILLIYFEFSCLTLMVYGYFNHTHFSIKTIFSKAKKYITKQLP